MVCHACKIGIHTGEYRHIVARASGRSEGPQAVMEVCKGDTWCDCQHRTNPHQGVTTDLR